jgi:hypothetical protein
VRVKLFFESLQKRVGRKFRLQFRFAFADRGGRRFGILCGHWGRYGFFGLECAGFPRTSGESQAQKPAAPPMPAHDVKTAPAAISKSKAELRAEFSSHPLLQALKEQFDAHIIACTPLDTSARTKPTLKEN